MIRRKFYYSKPSLTDYWNKTTFNGDREQSKLGTRRAIVTLLSSMHGHPREEGQVEFSPSKMTRDRNVTPK